MDEYRQLSTSGLLGYGFPEASLEEGLRRRPHMLGVDGGSTDPGPYYLGSGRCVNSRLAMKRDLALMLRVATAHGIPMVIGSCGGAGGEPHLQAVAELVREIARDARLRIRLALIHAEPDRAWIKRRLAAGRIRPCRGVGPLTEAAVDRAARIVAMMGPEPFQQALDAGAQVVLAGRASDPASWAACAIRAGLPPAPAWYAGKMLECGATAALPKGHDCLLATVRTDHVVCEPMNPLRRCTPLSVANHSLHENPSPCHFYEPGGLLDTTAARFEAVSDRAVRVSGMTWTPMPYTVKLEGAERVGARAVTVCGTRDPLLIGQIDGYLDAVRQQVADKAKAMGVAPGEYQLVYRVYGRDGVMGPWEPVRETRAHELGILIEVVADTQEVANAVLAIARTNTLHVDFPGRLCKEGNMAFPFSPSDLEAPPLYRFSVFHLVELDDPCEIFPIEYEEV